MDVSIRFDARDFEAKLAKLGSAEAQKIMALGVAEGMSIVADEARVTAPDSGLPASSNRKSLRGVKHNWKLKESIRVKEVKVSERGILGRIVALPFYAVFVERGVPSRGMAANPFMRRAAGNKRQAATEAFREYVRKAVEVAFR